MRSLWKVTGIADEAASDLEGQVRCHKELGWNTLELRNVDRTYICEMEEEAFRKCVTLLNEGDMQVVCFASPIANGSRPISSDFSVDVETLKKSILRMHRLGTKYIRIMSYPNVGLPDKQWQGEVFRRLRELTRIAESEGVVLLHENCSGWGGASPENQQKLLESMNSKHFRIVFDMANPAVNEPSGDYVWEFYLSAKPYIQHVHIKDCILGDGGKLIATYPGEGFCRVKDIVEDCLKTGFQGAFSIEPHMASQAQKGKTADGLPATAKEIYLEYGKRANQLLADIANGL